MKHFINNWIRTNHNRKVKNSNKKNRAYNYSYGELHRWAWNQPNIIPLFERYMSTRAYYLLPSIDRIDSAKNYTFDNMQIIKLEDNLVKGVFENVARGLEVWKDSWIYKCNPEYIEGILTGNSLSSMYLEGLDDRPIEGEKWTRVKALSFHRLYMLKAVQ